MKHLCIPLFNGVPDFIGKSCLHRFSNLLIFKRERHYVRRQRRFSLTDFRTEFSPVKKPPVKKYPFKYPFISHPFKKYAVKKHSIDKYLREKEARLARANEHAQNSSSVKLESPNLFKFINMAACKYRIEEGRIIELKELLKEIHSAKFSLKAKHFSPESQGENVAEAALPVIQLIELCKSISQQDLVTRVFNTLLKLFRRRGDYRNAQLIYDAILNRYLSSGEEAYVLLMDAYAIGGEMERTKMMAEVLVGENAESAQQASISLIKAHVEKKEMHEAFNVIHSMSATSPPTRDTFLTLLRACLQSRKFGFAWLAYDLMSQRGYQPDVQSAILLILYANKKKVKSCLKLLDNTMAQWELFDLRKSNFLLTTLSSRAEYYKHSLLIYKRMSTQKNTQPDHLTIYFMLQSASTYRDINDARKFFSKFLSIGRGSDFLSRAFKIMFESYAHAFRIDDEIRDYNSCHAINFEFLLDPTPSSIQDLVIEASKVEGLLNETVRNSQDRNLASSRAAFLSILTCYGYFSKATEYFSLHFLDKNCHPDIYSNMLQMCKRTQKKDEFYSLLEKTKDLLNPIYPASPSTQAQKLDYKFAHNLTPVTISRLHSSIISGLASFDDLYIAMDLLETQSQDSEADWERDTKHLSEFFIKVQDSEDAALNSRLDKLVPTQKRNVFKSRIQRKRAQLSTCH